MRLCSIAASAVFFSATFVSAGTTAFAQYAPDIYAITNAKIVLGNGKTLDRGTIVLRDGLIAEVGEKVTPPADAKVLDGSGMTLYPGLIDGFTTLGMPTASDYPAGRGDTYRVAKLRADNNATTLYRADNTAMATRRRLGFGAALVAPYIGIFSGTAAVMSLGDSRNADTPVLQSPVAMCLNWEASDRERGYPGALMGQIALSRQVLSEAKQAIELRDAYQKNPQNRPRPNVPREIAALIPVVEKKLPLIVYANRVTEIRRVLSLCQEFGLKPVIEGGLEAYAIADELKAAEATVLLSLDLPEPPKLKKGEEDTSTLQALRYRASVPRTAATLAKANVPFALTTSGLEKPEDFTKNVRKLIAAGLSPDAALTALTLTPARILGVERQLGTLEAGKIANLVAVGEGTLFEAKAKTKWVFVDGKMIDTGASRNINRKATLTAADFPLPPGVTKEQALETLRTQPDVARPFLPPGVTVEMAIAALSGESASQTSEKKDEAEKVTPPPPVGTGLIPPLPPALPNAFVIRGATVWTCGPQGILQNADVYVREGKIAKVGTSLTVTGNTLEISGAGKHVTPGLIDCHSHTAIDGGVNEGTNIITAECRVEDVIDPEDVNIYRQLAGGTTAANLLHGSANAIGGQNAVVKWRWGKSADQMKLTVAPPGIKFALGENPKRSNFTTSGEPRYPISRLGVEKVIREAFQKATDYKTRLAAYKQGKVPVPPVRDLQTETIVEILDGKRLVHCHAYRQDEMLMLIRLAEEYGIKLATFQHVLEGYKIADEMAEHGVGGSTFTDWWAFKIEAWDAIPYNGALMTNRGVNVSFNSDSSELARRMNLEAAKGVRYGGLSPEDALKTVTINPAKQLGIDKLVGSLEEGKDADLILWSGDPLSTRTLCEKTFVDGQLYFDRAADLAARAALTDEKKRLVAAERGDKNKKPETRDPKPETPTIRVVAGLSASPVPPSQPLLTVDRMGQGDSREPVDEVTVIVGGTVHPVSGPDIANGIVVVQNGKITAIGPAASVTVPANAKTVNATGLHVYPGLLDADTTLGLTEIDSIRATNDDSELGTFNAEIRAMIAVNPDSERIKVARQGGILAVAVAPSGGTVSGFGTVLQTDGWTWEDLSLNPAHGLYLNFPLMEQRRFSETAHRCEETFGSPDEAIEHDPQFRSGAFVPATSYDTMALRFGLPLAQPSPGNEKSTDEEEPEALKALNTFLEDARRYQTARNAAGKNLPPLARDPKLEGMLPVLEGKAPIFVRADREKDIRAAVNWAKKEKFAMVLVGAQEADKCAEMLAKEKIPVILGPVLNLPRTWDAPYDDMFAQPATLTKAGVRFCISTGDSANVRRLPHHAAMAAAFGLPNDEALKAITLYPAQILGVGNRLGSLEVGKDATLLLTTGDILEITSDIKAAWIQGNPVDLTNKQTRLYEKYKARPQKR